MGITETLFLAADPDLIYVGILALLFIVNLGFDPGLLAALQRLGRSRKASEGS